MGLRDRLKNRVRRLVQGEASATPPPPPQHPGLARPPAPAAQGRPFPSPPPAPPPPRDPGALPEETPPQRATPEETPTEEPEPGQPTAPQPGPGWFESDYATTDAPSRTAHHREIFETSDRALKVRVFDSELDRWLEFSCEPGEYVLDAADRAGLELPFSCRSGGCLSCAGKLVAGAADMGEQYVLEDEHVAAGFRLLCCTTVREDSVFLGNQEDEIE